MPNSETEDIEINHLLKAIFQRYGYDFRSYTRGAIKRRVRQFMLRSGCSTLSELMPKLLRDESLFKELVGYFSITVTGMFRDPFVYRIIREQLIPYLKTYPFLKIWHAGCATGEEVYSLAIILQEEGLYHRSTIFGTDFNDAALSTAKAGLYALDKTDQFTKNYQQASGTRSFSEYYRVSCGSMSINPSLKKNIFFTNHNLVTDRVFGEMHLIMCRNVLIYFNKTLRNRVVKLFSESLVHGGFLCLGDKESLRFTDADKDYRIIDEKAKLYQKGLECTPDK